MKSWSAIIRLLGLTQYALFSDVPTVTDGTIIAFLDAARANSQMRDFALRGDAAGTLQALTAFWQIFVRQGNIAPGDADPALAAVVRPFAKIQNAREVFDAGQKAFARCSTRRKLRRCGGFDAGSDARSAGRDEADRGSRPDLDAQQQMLQDMTRAFEAQRLISLETLFTLADRLESAASGQKTDATEMAKLASKITEVQLPRNSLTTRERTEMSAGYYSERHIDAERKANLRSLIDRAGSDPQKLREVRAALAPLFARYAGGPRLHPLRAARSAGTLHESAIRAESRFLRHAGSSARVDSHRGFRQRLARERRWKAGGAQAGGAALRARRGGTELPDPVA